MMSFGYDSSAAALVAYGWNGVTDGELRELNERLARLDADSIEREKTPVTILVVDEGEAPPPTAEQRRLMAAGWEPLKAPLHVFALVTKSPVSRGIFKVIRWLNPPGSRRRDSVHPTFEKALRWAEAERGGALPEMLVLLSQASAHRVRPSNRV
jgi:hypothetical protein